MTTLDDSEATYAPTLVSKPAENHVGGQEMYESLYNDGKRISEKRAQADHQIYGSMKFQPNTDVTKKVNLKLLEGSDKGEGDVVNRLFVGGSAVESIDIERKIKKEQEELKECTFIPKVNTLAGGSSKGEGATAASAETVHARLYSDARHKEETVRMLSLKVEEEEARPCTFQPQVTPRSRKSSKESPGGGRRGRSASPTGAKVHDRLYMLSTSSASRRLELAKAVHRDEDVECTFKPSLPANSKVLAREKGIRTAELYEMGKQEQSRRVHSPRDDMAALKLKLEDAELTEHCTFKPDVKQTEGYKYESPDGGSKDKLFERLYEDARKTEEARLRLADQVHSQDTFTPDVTETAQYNKYESPDGGSKDKLFERLYEDGRRTEEARQRLADQVHSQDTFTPDVTKTEQYHKLHGETRDADQGKLFERLYLDGKKTEESRQRLADKVHSEEGVTFQPALVATTVKADERNEDETIFEHLYEGRNKGQEFREAALLNAEVFSFKPELPGSKSLKLSHTRPSSSPRAASPASPASPTASAAPPPVATAAMPPPPPETADEIADEEAPDEGDSDGLD